jgi:hypothetical protein
MRRTGSLSGKRGKGKDGEEDEAEDEQEVENGEDENGDDEGDGDDDEEVTRCICKVEEGEWSWLASELADNRKRHVHDAM